MTLQLHAASDFYTAFRRKVFRHFWAAQFKFGPSYTVTDLLIRYRDSEGSITERLVSDAVFDGGDFIVAFCHLRQENRTFKLSRIQSVLDPTTGELIQDLLLFLGVRPKEAKMPIPPRPSARHPIPTGEELQKLRAREEVELWRPFRFAVVVDFFKKKFFSLFGNRCFKCGSSSNLEMDHHVPLALGGHSVPGNLVALCRRCNNQKLARSPSEFYSTEELERLAPLLEEERSLFWFEFDWKLWDKDRRGYLLQIGISADLVHEVLNNPEHRFFIPPPEEPRIGVSITIDSATVMQLIDKSISGKIGT